MKLINLSKENVDEELILDLQKLFAKSSIMVSIILWRSRFFDLNLYFRYLLYDSVQAMEY